MRFSILIMIVVSITTSLGCEQKNLRKATKNPLLGSWEMEKVAWKSPDTTISIEKAQPGVIMFTPKRYSLIWTPIKEKRKAFEILARPTEEEILAGFRSVVFNSGTYSFTDSSITTTALLAKVPGFEGGRQFYRYSLEKDLINLIFYDEIYPNGSKPEWSGKWETHFTLKRIDSVE